MRLVGLVLALALTLAPLVAEAQQAGKIPRVGILSQNSPLWEDFRQGLRDLGYVEGRTIVIDYRWGEGSDERFPRLAADLAKLGADVIVTRLSSLNPGLEAKRLELLKALVPKLSHVAVLWNPANPLHDGLVREVKDTASQLGVRLELVGVPGSTEFDAAFATMKRKRPDALIVEPDNIFYFHSKRIVDFATKSHLPAVFTHREFAAAGGLVVYGANYSALFRRAAIYVDKLLKGAKPEDLPVEQPTKFDLVINLKTAKTLGLTIPQSLLVRADEIIQ